LDSCSHSISVEFLPCWSEGRKVAIVGLESYRKLFWTYLLINLTDLVLCSILERHDCRSGSKDVSGIKDGRGLISGCSVANAKMMSCAKASLFLMGHVFN